jgi:hypothetical protein
VTGTGLRVFGSGTGGSTLICGRESLRGLCFVVEGVDLMTEFWEVEGARGWWESRRVVDVVDVVTLLAMEAVRFREFAEISEVLRLVVVRGAIAMEDKGREGW